MPSLAPPTIAAGDFVLILSCPDRPGIVHAVSGFLVEHGGNILESQQFGDRLSGRFFMRIDFAVPGPARRRGAARRRSPAIAAEFEMRFELWDARAPYRTLIMVSKHLHCLNDLLFRTEHRLAADRGARGRLEPPRRRRDGGVVRRAVPPRPGHARDQAAGRGAAARAGQGARRRPRGAGPLHAGALRRPVPRARRAGRSTSTTRSCRASRAPSPTTRPSTAA